MPSGAAPSGPTRDLKVVFTGPMGAGKTTAIRAISDSAALSTDVPISGTEAMAGKTMTTVGLDYGECSIDGQWVFKLFGTPGQDRFRFMWDILGAGAFGLIVLVDNSRPDPIGDVEFYLEAFEHRRVQALFGQAAAIFVDAGRCMGVGARGGCAPRCRCASSPVGTGQHGRGRTP